MWIQSSDHSLRDSGVARLDFDFPQISVVGDQKDWEELFERRPLVKVPRNERTRTKNPYYQAIEVISTEP